MEAYYNHLRQEAERLAGGIDDLAQRAIVYHRIYEDSQGNHTFPLLAAHGALWGCRFLLLGSWFANFVSYKYSVIPGLRQKKLSQLEAFSSVFLDINRNVCIEAYISYFLTKRYGREEGITRYVRGDILQWLNACHAATQEGRRFSCEEKKALYQAFFRWEQEKVVGPKASQAEVDFEWTCMKFFALRPIVCFSYFPLLKPLSFCNFSNAKERTENGMKAFDMAEAKGWDVVERCLLRYRVLPKEYFANPSQHFAPLIDAAPAVAAD